MKITHKISIYISFLLVTLGVVGNILCTKLLSFNFCGMRLLLSGSAPFFVFVFMFSNLLTELEGNKFSTKVIIWNYICVLSSVIMLKTIELLPGANKVTSDAFTLLFGNIYKFLIASVIAYACSMHVQSKLFIKLRSNNRLSVSLSHVFSTSCAQLLDISIFAFISYYIGSKWYLVPYGFVMLLDIVMSQYIFQVMVSIIATPLFKAVIRRYKA